MGELLYRVSLITTALVAIALYEAVKKIQEKSYISIV